MISELEHTCASTGKVTGKEASKGEDIFRKDPTVGAKKLQDSIYLSPPLQTPIARSFDRFKR